MRRDSEEGQINEEATSEAEDSPVKREKYRTYLFAIRVSFMYHKCFSALLYCSFLIGLNKIGIRPRNASSRLRIKKRVSAICTEKVQVVIVPLSQFRVRYGDEALVHDRSPAVETSPTEQFVIVKVAVRASFVGVERNVL